MRVLHIIADLKRGGAEMVLFRLVAATDANVEHFVVALGSQDDIGPMLTARGIRVESLGMSQGAFTSAAMRRLTGIVRDFAPDVVQTRLHHANLVGGLAARRVGVPVVWAVHATALGTVRDSWKTALVRALCAVVSHWVPAAIIYDAERSRALHAKLGFSRRDSEVVDNGIDLDAFRPDPAARSRQRAAFGVDDESILLGCVARWDPLKDHANLIAALAIVFRRDPAVRCALVGRGMTADNEALVRLIDKHGVRDRVILGGIQDSIAAVMNALDVHVLSSRSESAPVSVVEALACGTLCVVTDVGDSARLIGGTGWVCAPRDPAALAEAIGAGVEAARGDDRARIEAECRAHAERHFGLGVMAARYTDVWNRCASR